MLQRVSSVSALVLACAVMALSGCTGQDVSAGAPGWVEPTWITQLRQANEEYQSGQIACYAEYGFAAVPDMAGDVGFVNLPKDQATQDLLGVAAEDCNARVPLPERSKVLDDAAYQRMLDLRECIIAHGYDVPEPPSAETWKESNPVYLAWNPYQVFEGPAQTRLPNDALFALADACPQPGPNYIVRAPVG